MPSEDGSLTAVWTCWSSLEFELALLVAVFWARYWMSRNWSRIRLTELMLTPVPSWVSAPCCETYGITIDELSTVLTTWRV